MDLTEDQIQTLQSADLVTREAKAIYDNARLLREREIRRIAAEGGTYREIAGVAGVAYQRVAQIITGTVPATRERDDYLRYECPKCGARPGTECDGVPRRSAHIERHHAAIAVFLEQHPELG